MQKVQFALGDAGRRAQILSDKVAASFAPPSGIGDALLQQEMRSLLRGMSPGERIAAITGAMKSGDNRLAVAALSGPPVLSGLTEDDHGMVKQQFLAAGGNQDFAQAEALKEAIGIVEESYAQFRQHVKGIGTELVKGGAEIDPADRAELGV